MVDESGVTVRHDQMLNTFLVQYGARDTNEVYSSAGLLRVTE